MRKTFADLVRKTGVNYAEEYRILVWLINGEACRVFNDVLFKEDRFRGYSEVRKSFIDICNEYYKWFDSQLCQTTRSIQGFNQYYGISYNNVATNLDDLLQFVEYAQSFEHQLEIVLQGRCCTVENAICKHIERHLDRLISKLHHRLVWDGPFAHLVPENVLDAEVAARFTGEASIKTILYHHRSVEGNIAEKKSILKVLGDQLEPCRPQLKSMNPKLEDAVFMLLNNANIRHNNVTQGGKYYHLYVAGMDDAGIEELYDSLYEMFIAAFALLDSERALKNAEEFKAKIRGGGQDNG